jgi:hypothetical protein
LAENIDNIDIDEDDQSGDAEGLIDSSSFIFKQHTGKYLHGGGA